MRYFYVFLLTCFALSAGAQKQANIWHFGDGRAIDFNSGAPVVITGSSMATFEGSASYCDSLGNLLMYTNGGGREPDFSGQDPGHIWNANNQVMYDMLGTQGGGFSAAQSSVIVEAPGQPGIYYVLTMDELEFSIGASPAIQAAQPEGRGLSYFTVDMNANGGLGAVVEVDQRVFTPSFEALCAIRHSNQNDYWILINQDTLGIGIYALTASGISLQSVYTDAGPNFGLIKASPDGAWLKFGATLANFNPSTGVISNPQVINNNSSSAEFSPNSQYLYEIISAQTAISVLQYDLSSANIPNNGIQVATAPVTFSIIGQMQVAPDGNIYFIDSDFSTTKIHRINCPNTTTPSLELLIASFSGEGFFGLPNFPAWIFENDDAVAVNLGPATLQLCEDDFPFTLNAQNPGATYQWSTGESSQTITINAPGSYSVTVDGPCGSGTDTIIITPCSVVNECIDFLPTGSLQSWTVPAGVDSISVKMWGAAGGAGSSPTNNGGGGGGYTEFSLPVVPGDVLEITVGTGGIRSQANQGGAGGWPNGGDGGDGNRNETVFGVPTDVGGGGGGGGRTMIRISGSQMALLAVAGGGGGAAYGRYGGGGGGLEAEYSIDSNDFNVNGFGGTQTAGGAPGNNDLCPPPVLGSAGTSFAGGNGATDLASPNTGGGGGGDGYFGGGGGSSHDGCFGVGSTGGGGSGFLCATCPGLTGTTETAGFFGVAANSDDPLLQTYPGTATGLDDLNGGGGLVQICYFSASDCLPVTQSLTTNSCGPYVSNSGVSYSQSGTFTETFVAANGCDSILTLNLTISSLPSVILSTVASGCDNQSGSASANVTGGTPTYTYTWSAGSSSGPTVNNLPPGEIIITITDAVGCTATTSGIIEPTEGPDVSLDPSETVIFEGDSVQLNAAGALNYSWSPASGLSCTDCPNPVASPTSTTIYTVTGFDANGCLNTAQVKVNVEIRCGEVFIPTIFSPDGTGPPENETLCIRGNCIRTLNYHVYNRWGQVVFQTTDPTICWDGTFNGKPVDSGAYVYKAIITLLSNETIEESGTLTLIR